MIDSSAPHIDDPFDIGDPVDWGDVPSMIEGQSRQSGLLLHKGPSGESECGVWICTPGRWECRVDRDEFCHFVAGRCRYTHVSGDVIDVAPGTTAFFPAGWNGKCEISETVRKVYMVR